MNNAKSHFVGGTSGTAEYLKTSLGLIGADTRGGFSPEVTASLGVMARHAETHPDKQARLNGYVARLTAASGSTAETKPAALARAMPVTGMK